MDTLSDDVIMLLVNMILQPNGSQSLISQFLAALHVHGPHDIPSLWLSSQIRAPGKKVDFLLHRGFLPICAAYYTIFWRVELENFS